MDLLLRPSSSPLESNRYKQTDHKICSPDRCRRGYKQRRTSKLNAIPREINVVLGKQLCRIGIIVMASFTVPRGSVLPQQASPEHIAPYAAAVGPSVADCKGKGLELMASTPSRSTAGKHPTGMRRHLTWHRREERVNSKTQTAKMTRRPTKHQSHSQQLPFTEGTAREAKRKGRPGNSAA